MRKRYIAASGTAGLGFLAVAAARGTYAVATRRSFNNLREQFALKLAETVGYANGRLAVACMDVVDAGDAFAAASVRDYSFDIAVGAHVSGVLRTLHARFSTEGQTDTIAAFVTSDEQTLAKLADGLEETWQFDAMGVDVSKGELTFRLCLDHTLARKVLGRSGPGMLLPLLPPEGLPPAQLRPLPDNR